MIESIEIRNFQIHKKTKIDFDPGITIISGTSDNGKSSVIRCFRWLFDNRPQGYSFRRWGTPDKVVTAVDAVIDGEIISRKRGKIRNEYFFKDTTYRALRADVPDDIKEFLEVLPFNVQMQSGKVFLFENTDSEVAKMINDVSGISIIDDILKESNKRMRDLGAEEKVLANMIRDKKVQQKSLKVFVQHKKKMEQIKIKVEIIEEKEEILSDLDEGLSNYQELRKRKKGLPDIKSLRERVEKLKLLQESLSEKEETLSDIEDCISTIEDNVPIPENKLKNLKKRLDGVQKKSVAIGYSLGIVSILEDEIENTEYLTTTKKDNKRNAKEMLSEIESLKEECGMCPLCEKEW